MLKLKEMRRKNSMTQKQLGDMVGLSISAISLYEKGVNEPDIQTLRKFASIFHCSVDDLLDAPKTNSQDELDEFSRYKRLRLANKDFDNLIRKAEVSSPEHIRAAIAVLDALEPMA